VILCRRTQFSFKYEEEKALNTRFYQDLPLFQDLDAVLEPRNFQEIPDAWSVVLTDVMNSTEAIEKGKYKDVNIAGGLAAMALSNYFQNMDFPFLFGGDGVTFLVPDETVPEIQSILVDTRKKVFEFFQLHLRVGIVPASYLKQNDKKLLVGKWRISEFYNQAILLGDGVDFVEDLVKKPNSKFTLSPDLPITLEANFQGFSCRWKDIPSSQGETVSLIIKFMKDAEDQKHYQQVLNKIESIIGTVEQYHPLSKKNLSITWNWKLLSNEAKAVTREARGIRKVFAVFRIFLETLVTRTIIFFGLPGKAFFYELKNLQDYQIKSSDFRKFDGSLKMVVSLSKQKREKLEDYLQSEEKKGNLLFGMHISNSAHLTCLMQSASTADVHFVDGANGGYAMAAKVLKQKKGI